VQGQFLALHTHCEVKLVCGPIKQGQMLTFTVSNSLCSLGARSAAVRSVWTVACAPGTRIMEDTSLRDLPQRRRGRNSEARSQLSYSKPAPRYGLIQLFWANCNTLNQLFWADCNTLIPLFWADCNKLIVILSGLQHTKSVILSGLQHTNSVILSVLQQTN
jgi:hypothetical protein